MNQNEIRANWEHSLVGENHTYTLQAGSGVVLVQRRPKPAQAGVREADEDFESLVPVEELRGVLAEWDATVGAGLEKKS